MKPIPWASRVIAVDVDGVLADHVPHALVRAERELGVKMVKADITEWNTMVGSVSFDKLVVEWLRDPEWVKAMPLIDGAKEGLAALDENGTIIIATSIPEEAEKPRREWLEENLDFTGRIINTIRTGKGNIPADILIDDYPPNIKAFVESDTPERSAILLKQPWNLRDLAQFQNNDQVTVAEDWNQITGWAREALGLRMKMLGIIDARWGKLRGD